MSVTYLLVKVDGSVSRVEIEDGEFNNRVHTLIDCKYYELVSIKGGFYMVVDECGKILAEPKPVNYKCSMLYPGTPHGDPIVGDVVIGKIGYDFGEPDMTGLDEEELKFLERFFESVDIIRSRFKNSTGKTAENNLKEKE